MAAGDSAGAEVLLFEAIELAGAARDDELVASAWVEVVSVMSQSPRRGPGSALAIHAARGAINRIGGADGAYEPTLLKARAAILLADHHAPEARALFEEVAGLEERREPGGLRALESVANLAMALSAEGRPAQALPLLQHVVTAIEKKLGPDSEALIAPLRSKASVELELHRDAEAHLTLMRVQALAGASDDQEAP
jgi:eukaryotic-like serine/threonine-protein kinase